MAETEDILLSSDEDDENDPINQAFAKIINSSQKIILPKTPVASTSIPLFPKSFPVLPPLPPLPTLGVSDSSIKTQDQISGESDSLPKPQPTTTRAGPHNDSSLSTLKSDRTHLLLADTSSDSSHSSSDSSSSLGQLHKKRSQNSQKHRNGLGKDVSKSINGHCKYDSPTPAVNGRRANFTDSEDNSSDSDSADLDESQDNLFESLRRFDEKTKVSFHSSSDFTSSDSSSYDEDSSSEDETDYVRRSRRNSASSDSSSSESDAKSPCLKYSSDRSFPSCSRDSGSDSRPRSSTLRQRLGLTPVHNRNYDQYRFDHKTQRETSIPPNFNPKTPPEEDYPEDRRTSSRASSISSNGFNEYYSRHYDYRGSDCHPRLLNRTPMNTPPEDEPVSPIWLQYVKNPEGLREQYLNNNRGEPSHLPRRPELESPVRPNLESRIKVMLGTRSSSNEDSPVKNSDPILRPKIPRPLSRPPSPFLNKNAYLFWYKETYLFKKNHKIGTYACADPTVRRKIGIQIKTLNSLPNIPGSKVSTFTPIQKKAQPILPKNNYSESVSMELPTRVKKASLPNGAITKIHVPPETELELCTQSTPTTSEELLDAVKLRVVEELKSSLKRDISHDFMDDMLKNATKKVKLNESPSECK